jgi:hypothetical protein
MWMAKKNDATGWSNARFNIAFDAPFRVLHGKRHAKHHY